MKLNEKQAIVGSGGKSGGAGAYGSKEDPNNLVCKSVARIVEVLGEGEIGGLVNGGRSVFLEGTPLQNPDDSYNFKGVDYWLLAGTPDQDSLPNFDCVEGEVQVGVKVQKANPIVRTITDTGVDDLRIKVSFGSLLKVSTSDGSIKGASVEFTIAVRSGGELAQWQDVKTVKVAGKTNTTYEKQILISEIQQYGPGPWDVRITRITADSEDSNLQNEFYWSTYTTIIRNKFSMPNVAALGMIIDAKQFGTNIPTRAYDIYGLNKIAIPSNYDPHYGTYTGIWDGTFTYAWTCNPAWVIYDLVTNTRYGLGVDPKYVDKWSFYSVSQYCDELVPDGFGSMEHRFTFNGVLQTAEEAYHTINAIASSCLCMPYWASGMLTLVQDAPRDPSHLACPANVIDGVFNYAGTGLKSRHSVALVTWNDPLDQCRQAIEVVDEWPELIAKLGWAPLDVTAMGCTRRSQAHRLGRWLVETEQSNETVTFTGGFEYADCVPGSIVLVQDPAYAGVRFGGRIAAATTTQVTLDAEVTLEAGQSYTLSVVLPDGTISETAVSNTAGKHTVLNIAALAAAPMTGAIWVLSGSNLAPRQFRVVTNVETEPNQFEVTAILHDPDKYRRVYDSLVLEPVPGSNLPSGTIAAPDTVNVKVFSYEEGRNYSFGAILSWRNIPDPRVSYYEVEYRLVTDDAWKSAGETVTTSVEIKPLLPGDYEFRVRGRGVGKSEYTTVSAAVDQPYPLPPSVTNVKAGSGGNAYTGNAVTISWNPAPGTDLYPVSRHRDYKVEICTPDGVTVKRTIFATSESIQYTTEMLLEDFGVTPPRTIRLKITTEDINKRCSSAVVFDLTKTAPTMSAFTPTVAAGINGIDIDWSGSPIQTSQVSAFDIYCNTTSPPVTKVATVSGGTRRHLLQKRIEAQTTFFVKIIPVDVCGEGAASLVASVVMNADNTLVYLNEISSGGVITAGEKYRLAQEWALIRDEAETGVDTLPAQANYFGVSHTSFDSAYSTLKNYLQTTLNVFGSMSTSTTIDRAVWDGKWKDYYTARTALLNAISAKAKTLADGAASTATTAKNGVDALNNDSKVTPNEKTKARREWNAIVKEGCTGGTYGTLIVQADALGVDRAAFTAAYNALDVYLNITLTLFTNMTATAAVARTSEWDAKWNAYYDERTKLIKAICDKASTMASWSGTSSKPANLSELVGTESIKNSAITVDAGGAIQGVGSGAGTIVSNDKIAAGNLAGTGKVFTTLPQSGATVGAPAGTTVGGLPAATIASWVKPNETTIDGNKIYTGDAYVDTLQIKGNAIWVPAETHLTTNKTIYDSGDVLTLTIDSLGGNIIFMFGIYASLATGVTGTLTLTLVRGDTGAAVFTLTETDTQVLSLGMGSVMVSPPSGSITYALHIVSEKSGSQTITCKANYLTKLIALPGKR